MLEAKLITGRVTGSWKNLLSLGLKSKKEVAEAMVLVWYIAEVPK